MRIAIVGGGINGLCCAWTLASKDHRVELFERGQLMSATSQASSKLLHGGLRYLETGQFRLVHEALCERDAWLARAPHLASPLFLTIPIYTRNRRKRWHFGLGLRLYRLLAGASQHRDYRWLDREALLREDPELYPEGLLGGYRFTDGQMDDHALGPLGRGACLRGRLRPCTNTRWCAASTPPGRSGWSRARARPTIASSTSRGPGRNA